MVIAASDFVVAWGWVIVIGLGIVGYMSKRYYDTENGRFVIDAVR